MAALTNLAARATSVAGMVRALFRIATLLAVIVIGARRFFQSRADEELDEVDLAVIAGSLEFRSKAKPFIGGTLLAMFASVEIDLRRVTPAPTGIELGLAVVASRVTVVVPPGWNLAWGVHNIAGNLSPQPEGAIEDAPWLRIIGRTVGGRIEVVTRGVPTAV